MEKNKIFEWINKNWIPLLMLLIVITLSVQLRLYNAQNSLSGMDPYFYAQWSERIIENDMQLPVWNEFSHYPPGRPTIDMWPLWSYIEAVFYLTFGQGMEFVQFIHYMPAYFIVFVVFSAFLLGRKVSNSNYGGVIASYFVSFSMMFFNRSANGFADSDGLVFALTFLTAYTTLKVIEKPDTINYLLAIFSYFLFTQAWSQPYWVFVVFVATVPILFAIRYIESYRDSKAFDWKEFKSISIALLVVVVISSAFAFLFNGNHIISSLSVAMQFMGGEDLIVNRSIAELQAHGELWTAILQNIGPLVYVVLFGFFAIFAHDLYYKKKISFSAIFLSVWFFGTLYLSGIGSRYILMLTMSMTASVAFVIIQGYRRIPERFSKNIYIISLLAGLLLLHGATHISEMQNYALATSEYGLSQNWVDSLEWLQNNTEGDVGCFSYWDFGHIISYYNLHNMFDGAQGLLKYTYPYNHNERIHDSGKMFATSNESLALELLDKYRGFDDETCLDAKRHYKEAFGIDMPDEMCDDLDEVYLLSSADLISKFTWLSYFGSIGDGEFHFNAKSLEDVYNSPGHCVVQYDDTAVWCMWSMQMNNQNQFVYGDFTFEFLETENGSIPIMTTPMSANIVDSVYYNGNVFDFSWFKPEKEHNKGQLIILNNQAIYIPEQLKDSIFVRTFIYNGQGLEHFEYVYGNNDVKLFKVHFNTS